VDSGLTATEAAELYAGAFQTSVLARMVNDITLDSVHVKFGPNDIGSEGDWPVGVAGGSSGDDQVPSVAMLVKKNTELGGRANRGRMYLPGLNESVTDTGGVIDASELPLWQAELETFFDEVVAADLPPVVLHSEDSPVSTPTPIISLTVDSKAATQRRRMRH
jgi:hypothetical protein